MRSQIPGLARAASGKPIFLLLVGPCKSRCAADSLLPRCSPHVSCETVLNRFWPAPNRGDSLSHSTACFPSVLSHVWRETVLNRFWPAPNRGDSLSRAARWLIPQSLSIFAPSCVSLSLIIVACEKSYCPLGNRRRSCALRFGQPGVIPFRSWCFTLRAGERSCEAG